MSPRPPIVALGEVLWDLLPSGPRAGGAPFNFAFHCHQLGHPAVIVSRVGDDDLGRKLRTEVRRLGLSDEYIQTDPDHATGTVVVEVGPDGQPAFAIADDVAWDYVQWEPRLESLADSARAVCFGTLAQRRGTSRETIRRFARQAHGRCPVIFDVNFRRPFDSGEPVWSSVDFSDWVKVNEDEFEYPIDWSYLDLDLFCLTRGSRGCFIQTKTELIDLPGIRVPVADTVGCGDAFTAALLTQHLEGEPLAEAARFANAYAAVVASKPGGTPSVELAEVEMLL